MQNLLRIFRREAGAYFASPVAYLFIGTFLAVTLFIFFWAEAFFSRNIADVRPLFEWMPILLIALVATLTMRSWSEELRSGTVEVLLTAPVSSLVLVAGKFLAVLSLIAVALALTLPLPVTVQMLGPLDWGPVIGGYVASLFLAAAYTAMGLFVSSRTDNPIISLIVTALVGGAFYVIGTDWLTALAPDALGQIMHLVGTGARFEEITRGVLDLRDVYYYVSLVGLFLALNVYSLERLRWGDHRHGSARRHMAWRVAAALVAVNFLAANLWMTPISYARADITEGNQYTLGAATNRYVANLQQPLVIKGFLSSQTHPLIRPLVPQMQNLLREYAIAGGDQVRVELVDPQTDTSAAEQARQAYGIEPVPLQTASRYQSSVVSAYFHVLVKYGDQHTVLNLQDLVQAKGTTTWGPEITLRNPEYQITSAIREVANKWRSGGDVLASLEQPVTFHGYISPAGQLPEPLKQLREELGTILDELRAGAEDKLDVEFRDPGSGDGALAERLQSEYGFQAMTTNLLSDERFYFHMVLEQGDQTVPVTLPDSLEAADLRSAIESALQRFGQGFRKTVAVHQPPQPRNPMLRRQAGPSYRLLMRKLRESATVTQADLSDGQVTSNADFLLILSPEELSEKQRYAIDQFLMRGGTVAIAGSPMQVQASRRTGVQVNEVVTGLEDWLASFGVTIENSLVLDPQSGPLTLPTQSGGRTRMQTFDYPYFLDIRDSGLADVPMLGSLNQLTMAWASPVRVDPEKAGNIQVTELLNSSERAWTSDSTDVLPDYQNHPELGFPEPQARARQPLGVMLEGRFTSAFQGQSSPLAEASGNEAGGQASGSGNGDAASASADGGGSDSGPTVTSVIQRSPASARLIVFGSGNFLSDRALQIVSRSTQSQYITPVQLAQNIVDWSLGDPALLALRGEGRYSGLLRPVPEETRRVWEAANYGTALGGLLLVFAVRRIVATRQRRWYEGVLNRETK
ncbi:Gldg family protein [Aquisalimonas lutea]|uniref:Gldg family protein n=1 Tax=Aquisalimonas lutea TaxID=1327750 RepID=UPI0025B545C5|nr:Gldg family protein [Aquisalimonas lutea]MDN3518515.1 Gldg family protein [Aquisalimonas lutea]